MMQPTAIPCAVSISVYLFSSTEAALSHFFYDAKLASMSSTTSSPNYPWPQGDDTSPPIDDWTPATRLIVFGIIMVIALTAYICAVYLCSRRTVTATPRSSIQPTVTVQSRTAVEAIDFSKPFALKCSADGSFYASPVQDILPLPSYEQAVTFAKKSHSDLMQV